MCQICNAPVLTDAIYPEPLSPTIDHIVPLSRDGKHQADNVQLAHWLCNARKSDRLDARATPQHPSPTPAP